MRYDVIVVGSGPAGSAAAREAAACGLTTLLLDKVEFPRDKPCGGGVNLRTARLLPFDLAPVVERAIFGVQMSLRQAIAFARFSPSPLTYLTQRSRLDAYLVEQAIRAGATFRDGQAVRAVELDGAGVTVRTGNDAFDGRVLIGADGANGRVTKLTGLDGGRWMGVALEGNITPEGGIPDKWQETLALEVGAMPGGYGWLFPKGDHLNVGIGGWRYLGPRLRGRLDRLARFYDLDPARLWGVRGHHLPMRQPDAPLASGNVLLVGDAAGLLDPFTGEGIYAATRSGIAAAHHAAAYLAGDEPDLSGYARTLARDLLPELAVSRRLQDLFHFTPAIYITCARILPGVWDVIFRLVRGELTYLDLKRKIGPMALGLDALSNVIRTHPRWRQHAGLPGTTEDEGS